MGYMGRGSETDRNEQAALYIERAARLLATRRCGVTIHNGDKYVLSFEVPHEVAVELGLSQ